jgi:predicted anti-sigma-YlaC factor YlaD
MSCAKVRTLLPEYADAEPAGEVAAHLASCSDCAVELAQYRRLLTSLSVLEHRELAVPPGYLERMVSLVPAPSVGQRVRSLAHARPVGYALASLGGAAVGATAIGLVLWRRARAEERTETPAGVAV